MGKAFDKQEISQSFDSKMFWGSKNVFKTPGEFTNKIEEYYNVKTSEVATAYIRYNVGYHIELEGERGFWQPCDPKEYGAFEVWFCYKSVRPQLCITCPTWEKCEGSNIEDCEHRLLELKKGFGIPTE